MNERAKLEDVAQRAGVSPRTVSRVVNGLPHVSRKARQAIEQAIAELDYRPSFAARALASSRSWFIGIVGPGINSGYFDALNSGLISACRERGYHPVMEQYATSDDAIVEQLKRSLREVRFAGLVLLPGASRVPAIRDFARSADIPHVAVSPPEPEPDIFTVRSDEQQGEIALAEALWSQGHRRFGIATAPAEYRFPRGRSFRQRLLALGADPAGIVDFPLDLGLPGLEAGRQLGEAVARREPRPTALFAFNDEMAAGAIGYFLTIGLGVPQAISVAGFDDAHIAQAIWPPLTTIRQPIEAMAHAAIDCLLGEGEGGDTVRTLPVELVVRASTGPAPDPTRQGSPPPARAADPGEEG